MFVIMRVVLKFSRFAVWFMLISGTPVERELLLRMAAEYENSSQIDIAFISIPNRNAL